MNAHDDLRALVVEDHPLQRRFLVKLLELQGVQEIAEAGDGASALEMLRAHPDLDVLFLDLQMPGMDGVELLYHVQEAGFSGGLVIASGLEPELVNPVEQIARQSGIQVLGQLAKPPRADDVKGHLVAYRRSSNVQATTTQPSGKETELKIVSPPGEAEIRNALDSAAFIPWFQPKVSLVDGTLCGVESLVRWSHPERGLLAPGEFLDAVSRFEQMVPLTLALTERVMQQCRDWREGGREIPVSINIPPEAVLSRGFLGELDGRIRALGIPPTLVTLEVTEDAVRGDISWLVGELVRFRMKGYQISVDDFGTGYSSLQQLSRVPFSELKIDRSFIHNVRRSTKLQAIVQSSLELAQRLGLRTVAEGIETVDDWQYLRSLGCDLCQGYFSGRPVPGEQLLEWEREWRNRYHANHGFTTTDATGPDIDANPATGSRAG